MKTRLVIITQFNQKFNKNNNQNNKNFNKKSNKMSRGYVDNTEASSFVTLLTLQL